MGPCVLEKLSLGDWEHKASLGYRDSVLKKRKKSKAEKTFQLIKCLPCKPVPLGMVAWGEGAEAGVGRG